MARTRADEFQQFLSRRAVKEADDEASDWLDLPIKEAQDDDESSSFSEAVDGDTSVKMEYIVDIQGFQMLTPYSFVLKEIAIVSLADDVLPRVYTFQAPTPWTQLLKEEQCVARWLERNHHGIPWSCGDLPYKEIGGVLKKNLENAETIYVKGLEKEKWLQEFLPKTLICDLEKMGCPSLKKLYRTEEIVFCTNHELCYINPVCAIKNALTLKNWLVDHRQHRNELSDWDVDEPDCSDSSTRALHNSPRFNRDILSMMYN